MIRLRVTPNAAFAACVLAFASMIVTPSQASAASQSGDFSVRGMGANSCSDLTAHLEESGAAGLETFGAWVAGYLTHANRTTSDVYDAMPVLDNRIVARMTANLCAANPASMVETALANLIVSFERGAIGENSPTVDISHEGSTTTLRREALRLTQEQLIEQGHLPEGSADGSFGPRTRQALTVFQTERGIETSGIPDAATLINLFVPDPSSQD